MYVRARSGVWKNGEKGGGGQKMVGRKMDSRDGSLCLFVTMHACLGSRMAKTVVGKLI